MKSGRTFTPGYFENLKYWQELSGSDPSDCYYLSEETARAIIETGNNAIEKGAELEVDSRTQFINPPILLQTFQNKVSINT